MHVQNKQNPHRKTIHSKITASSTRRKKNEKIRQLQKETKDIKKIKTESERRATQLGRRKRNIKIEMIVERLAM